MKILNERFEERKLHTNLQWLNEPGEWSINETNKLLIKTEDRTDFWQRTHYGFRRDDGHFLYTSTCENFEVLTKLEGTPRNRYDQAGLMIRLSEDNWIKTSIEYLTNTKSRLGAVVTRDGYSDWSSEVIEQYPSCIFHKISRKANTYYIDYSYDGENWNQIRIAHVNSEDKMIAAGIYCCSPQGEDATFSFSYLEVNKLNEKDDMYK